MKQYSHGRVPMGHIRIFMVPLLHFQFYTLQGIEQNKLEDLVLFDVNAMSNIHLCIYSNTHIPIGYMSM